MKYKCGVCGDELIENEPFCRKCGTKVDYKAIGVDIPDKLKEDKAVINIYLIISILAYLGGLLLLTNLLFNGKNCIVAIIILFVGLAINVSGLSAYPRAYQLKATLIIGVIFAIIYIFGLLTFMAFVNNCIIACNDFFNSCSNCPG